MGWAVVTYADTTGSGWAVPIQPGMPTPAPSLPLGSMISGPQIAWDPAGGTNGTFLIAYVVDTKVWVRTLSCAP